MRITYIPISIFMCAIASFGFAQEQSITTPTYEGTVSSVEYVTPMSERPEDLIPPDNTPREAKDKRSMASQLDLSKNLQEVDDYFVTNKHELEGTKMAGPPSLVFDTYTSNSQPTDPSLAVGPNHVMVVFNTGFAIYDKLGVQLQAPTAPNPAIFPNGGCCDLTASYDNAADRWVLSFLSSTNGAQVAISDGPNPVTAGWFVYTISAISDYQKLSIWSDGYYITENTTSSNKVWALERSAMLTGDTGAQIVSFSLPGLVTSGFHSPQALNVIDNNIPAAGGATIVYMQDNAWSGVSTDHIKLWTIDVNWTNTSSSTVSSAQEIPVTSFISVFDGGSFSNLQQPGSSVSIDALQATIMNQAQFKKFAGHNSAIFNFVVDADGGSGKLAAIRWMEFRQSGDNQPWSLYQEGTYTAPDGKHAWNASMGIDGNGNIGMGYTGMSGPTTSGTVRVSSFYTGRLSSDPIGTMTFAEEVIANGNANIPGTRYGDYSKVDVDPSNGTDFWFITEYMNSSRRGVVGVFELDGTPPPVDTEDPTNPSNLVASNIGSSNATLTWNAATDNIGVTQYNISIDGAVVGTSGGTSFVVTGLSPTTNYTASVNAQDAAGNTSAGSASTSFTTGEVQITYCNSASSNVSDEYISRVQLNTIDNVSGAQFYSDFTGISTALSEGDTYTVTVTPTWVGTIYAEGYAVWIDYNNDGDFTDAGELVWSKTASTNTPNSGTFTVPSGTSLNSTRMRVSMGYNDIPTSCEAFTYGEVEDYTVNLEAIGGDTQAPSTPINLSASNIGETTLDLTWNASSDNFGVTGYNVFLNGSNIGTTAGTSSAITGLSAGTTYTFNVSAFDAAGNVSGLSNNLSATTASSADTQAPSTPTSLTASNITETTVDLSWNASSDNVGVTGYEVFIDGGSIGTVTGTSTTITGLTGGTSYAFNVSAFDAAGNNSGQSNTANATTTSGADTQAPTTPTSLSVSNIADTSVDLTWNASNDNVGVTGYNIFVDGSNIGSVTGTAANITGLTANTSYTFNVSAFDAAGNTSAQSNTANATTTGGGGTPGVIGAYYFESGWDGWSDGGSDCARISSSTAAFEGQYSIRVRDNSNSSNARSPILNLAGNTQVTFEFHYYASGMENGEDFFVEFYNGSSYQVIGQYTRPADFTNGGYNSPAPIVLNSSQYSFNSNNRFRIRNDASNNNDRIYFDQVIISGDNVASILAPVDQVMESVDELKSFSQFSEDNVKIYPNPTNSMINVEILEGSYDEITVFSTTGQLIYIGNNITDKIMIDVSEFSAGMYFVRFVSNGRATTKRFIKE